MLVAQRSGASILAFWRGPRPNPKSKIPAKVVFKGCNDSENARFSSAWVPEAGTAVTARHVFCKAKGGGGIEAGDKFTVLTGDNEYDAEVIKKPEPLSFTIRGVQGVGDPDCPIPMTTQSGYAALSGYWYMILGSEGSFFSTKSLDRFWL